MKISFTWKEIAIKAAVSGSVMLLGILVLIMLGLHGFWFYFILCLLGILSGLLGDIIFKKFG